MRVRTYFGWEAADAAVDYSLCWAEVCWGCLCFGHDGLGHGVVVKLGL